MLLQTSVQSLCSMREGSKLLDVCSIQYGYPFESAQFSSSKEDGIPLIRIRDVKSGYSETYYKGSYAPEFVIHRGDYLIGMDGEFNIARWQSEDALLNQRVCKIEGKSSQASIDYVYRFLTKELKRIEDETPFVTVKHLSAKRLNQVVIPLPPLPEQERIVAELDCLSVVIEKQKQQLKELDNLAQSIFYTTFGDPISNNFGWKNRRLGEIVNSNMIGLTRSGSEQDASYEYLYFKMNNIGNEGGVDWSKTTRVNACAQEVEKYTLKEGDFLFNTRNSFELVGKTCIYPHIDGEVCLFNNNIMRIDFKKEINVTYMAYLFQDKYIKNQLDRIKKGTTSVWAIYYKDLEKIDILVPDIALQEEFASKVAAIEQQKEIIKQSIAETETLFNSRMDYYFN